MILDAFRINQSFGMLDVDIEVPQDWPEELKDRYDMSPYDYFQEM